MADVGSDGAELAPTRLVLVRHGESRATVERRIGGPRTCSGLTDLGRRQAERLRDRLAETGEVRATELYASTYQRARETAEVIAPVWGLDVRTDAGLGEHEPGPECDGLTFDEFVERFGTPDWESDPHDISFPGGETVAELHHRIGANVSKLIRRHPGGVIVVVCHGGVVNAAFRGLLGLPMTGGFELFTGNASLTELVQVRPGRWRLVRYDDVAHLAGLPERSPRA